jgi:hypothetical protein
MGKGKGKKYILISRILAGTTLIEFLGIRYGKLKYLYFLLVSKFYQYLILTLPIKLVHLSKVNIHKTYLLIF